MSIVNNLSTYLDIINLTKNRIDELDQDDQIDTIVRNAINYSYLHDLSKIFKRFTSTILPVINGIATLPDDLLSIESISPALVQGEYRKGNALFSNINTTFTIVYQVEPEALVNDTDAPDLPLRALYLMSDYACCEYYNFKKRTNISQVYMQKYTLALADYESDNIIDDNVQDVYSMNLDNGDDE